MLKLTIVIGLVLLSLFSQAQEYVGTTKPSNSKQMFEPKTCISTGVGFGGSLIGADLEFLVFENIGFQIGAGLIGFDAGATIHFKHTLRSSFLLVNYIQTGTGDFYAKMVGLNFIYRSPKWFTAGVGIGLPKEVSPDLVERQYHGREPDFFINGYIGAYFPF